MYSMFIQGSLEMQPGLPMVWSVTKTSLCVYSVTGDSSVYTAEGALLNDVIIKGLVRETWADSI